ncbi:PASTA domain-containing protein [Microbispora bryophytorum]|uniref:PASTA domain-containing protein n=1 Tax=Microbispora bryophytorum TaxID=1460882 RepID=UPI00340D191F
MTVLLAPTFPMDPAGPSADSGGGTRDGCTTPALAGLTLLEARERLTRNAPDTIINPVPADIPESWPSYVIDVQSECGRREVTLRLGVRMPDLHGSTLREATDTLAAMRVGIGFLPEEAGSEWKVVTQNPGAGELIRYDTSADVEVVAPSPSAGVVSPSSVVPSNPPARVTVPALKGLDLAHAREKLAAAGLRLRLDPDSPHSGTVAGQTPAEGKRVVTRTTVTVRLAREEKGDAAASGDEEQDLTTMAGAVAVVLLIVLIGWWARGRRPEPAPPPGRRPEPAPPPGRRPAADRSSEHRPGSLSVLCVPHPDPVPRVLIRPTARTAQAAWPDIRVESHPDPGHQELREVPR